LPSSPPRLRVLVVEDNPDGREALRRLLSLSGFEVEVAEDGAQGVTRGQALAPGAAVVDLGLPVLDGFEVARELRRAFGGAVVLIAHSAYADPATRERAGEAGFDHFLRKPCDLPELVRLLRAAAAAG